MSFNCLTISPRASAPTVLDSSASSASYCSAYSSGAPARDVVAQPLVRRVRDLAALPVGHVGLGVRTVPGIGEHLDVGKELAVGVRAGRVAAEEDVGADVAQLSLHADLFPPLLDQRLRRLAHGVGGGLVENAQLHAVLVADAVAVGVYPTGFFQQRLGAFDILNQSSPRWPSRPDRPGQA